MLVIALAFWSGRRCRSACAGVEVVDDVVPLRDRISRHVGGVEAEVAQTLRLVPVQQGAVVAADVDDEVPGLQRHDRFDAVSDPVEILGHRAVDPAAIPVGAVEDRPGDRVLGLDQAACFLVARHVAAHQLERDRTLDRLVAAGIRKRPGDALVAERQHGREVRAAADAACGARDQTGAWCGFASRHVILRRKAIRLRHYATAARPNRSEGYTPRRA